MAYTEKLLGIGDLLAAWQNRANREQSQPTGKQIKYQEQMMQAQLDAAQLANKKAEAEYLTPAKATIKGPGYDATTGMGTKTVFLSELPGYVNKVDPAILVQEKAATDRAMIGAMARGGYGGGGGGGGADEKDIKKVDNFDYQDPKNNYVGGYNMANLMASQAQPPANSQGGAGSPITQGLPSLVPNVDTTIGGMKNQMDAEALANAREFQSGQKGRDEITALSNAVERFRLGDTSAVNEVSPDQQTKLLAEKKKEIEGEKLSAKTNVAYKEMYETQGFSSVVEKAKSDPAYAAIISEIDGKMRDKVSKSIAAGKPINYRLWLADLVKQAEAQKSSVKE
jgi:hypothetical protein